jgi:methylated-DNA-[protein]-cysteine S-methyltransferase
MQTLMPRAAFDTAIGRCAVAWEGELVTRFWLPEALAQPGDETDLPRYISAIITRVQAHVSGRFQHFSDVSYDFRDESEFNIQVLRATLAIRAGETRSYGEIAAAIGQPPGASRAVGTALGANRWPLLIPCHRVVSATGKMTGFSGPGGIKTKLRLLALEGAQLFAE